MQNVSRIGSGDLHHQLRMIRTRVDRLRDILHSMLQYPPAPLDNEWWMTCWVDRFGALAQQYKVLWRELEALLGNPANLPLLTELVVVPTVPLPKSIFSKKYRIIGHF